MFKVLVINSNNKEDICIDREYENEKDAEKYYNLFKENMVSADKDDIFRQADEELHQVELKYTDITLYLYDGDKRISKFKRG